MGCQIIEMREFIKTKLMRMEGETGPLLDFFKWLSRKHERVTVGTTLYFFNHFVNRVPSHYFRLFFYRRLFQVGEGTSILLHVRLRWPRNVKIGRHSTINYECTLDGRGALLQIGNNVDIGPQVTIWTAEHDVDSPTHQSVFRPVIIEDDVWIASRAMIMPGVTIGRGAVVAAGAVVFQNIEPYTVVAGNPARAIKRRSPQIQYQLAHFPFLQ